LAGARVIRGLLALVETGEGYRTGRIDVVPGPSPAASQGKRTSHAPAIATKMEAIYVGRAVALIDIEIGL
jgi:hypothetical protein